MNNAAMKNFDTTDDVRTNSFLKNRLLSLLGWYRQYRGLRPDACRFDPTCSAYTVEAVETHGAFKGLYYGTRRVLRCHPLGGRGHDPVPPLKSPAPPNVQSTHV